MKFLFSKIRQPNTNEFDLKSINQIIIFKKYHEIISNKKKEIDDVEVVKYWDKMKKIGNPFELIYTSYNKKRKNDSISLYSPISRSYFKLWEIFYNFNIFQYAGKRCNCSHLAEGPGGFMEASINYLNNLRKKNCHYWGLTLKPNDEFVPDWNKIKKIFKNEKNYQIEYGDLYNYDEVIDFIFQIKNKEMDLVTADGGFDYSSDFNGQELNSCRIIYSEIALALNILKKNGCFVIKMFDLFTVTSIQCLQLLIEQFEEVYIYKPETSRQANSEKYIVCLYYKNQCDKDFKENLLTNIKLWKEKENYIFTNTIDNTLVHELNQFNKKFVNNQVSHIHSILKMIRCKLEKDEYHCILKNQVTKALDWCKNYDVPINKESIYYKKNNS
jgi:23S rRNA U2552 (ribose-2'-O)-methylase RlmE/FtsJ